MQNVDPRSHSRLIEAALESGAAARSAVAASWSRSARMHGLDPAQRARPQRMTGTELRRAVERMEPLVRAAGPSLDRLFQAVGGVGCCVLLADREGVPLDRRGAPADDTAFEDWGLWPGVRWSEADQGTNGIGTALVEGRAVTIHGEDHFLSENTALTCISTPLYDHDGQLCGVLDVSSGRADLTAGFQRLIAHAVAEAAQRIEVEALRLAFPRARIVLPPGADGAGGGAQPAAALAVDGDDLVVGATRAARALLRLPPDLGATPVPTADLFGQGDETLAEAETAVLRRALARAGGNVSAAARQLGISRATLHRKIAAPRRG